MAKKNRRPGEAPNDDIARGNTGTADQGPGDVSPDEKVGAHTGVIPETQGPPRDKREDIQRRPGPVR